MTQDIVNFLLSEAPSATIIALVGGTILKIIEKKISTPSDELNSHMALRQSLREELDKVHEEILRLQAAENEWREKYYSQVELTNQLRLEVALLKERLDGNIVTLEQENE